MWVRDNEQLCNVHDDKLRPSVHTASHHTGLRAYPYRLSDIALVAEEQRVMNLDTHAVN